MASSGGQALGTALTGGIQDISALLPLLGTEQCEDHIASALTNGYLYAAATPLSIFGSLGAARAGFKTLLSATSIRRFVGAKILADAGFRPQGENLSLIMLDDDRKSYCAEKRLASMMADIHLEDSNKISVFSKCWTWNIEMILVTAFSCIVSITPYIHLNLHANSLNHFVRWAFPVTRAIGGFLTATMIQLVIQTRVLSIMRKRLVLDSLGEGELQRLGIDETGKESSWVRFPALDQRCSLLEKHVRQNLKDVTDLEKGGGWNTGASPDDNESTDKERLKDLRTRIIQANGSAVLGGTFILLLFIGIIASVLGYVGCFTAVQGSNSSTEALIWLCLEAGLSIIRIILWGLNPKCDDAPPLKLTLKLNTHAPIPTCTRPAEEIEETKILPLVRAPEFLKAITSYAGLLTQFTGYPLITLYYTLTRRNDETPESSKRVLYITIFDHTERTTRVYSEDYRGVPDNSTDEGSSVSDSLYWNSTSSEQTYFYSANGLTIDLKLGILTTKIGRQIQHQDDPIARNAKLRIALAEHYHSILHQVNSGIGNHHPVDDTVDNNWTLELGEEKSDMQKFGTQQNVMQTSGGGHTLGNSEDRGDRKDEKAAENGEDGFIKLDHIYLEQRRVEQKIRNLIRDRGKHIEVYMDWVYATADDELRTMKIRHIEADPDEEMHAAEIMLMEERKEMELMLVDEVREWEEKLRECRRGVIAQLSSYDKVDADTRTKLERRWRANLWEWLKDGERAMKSRMNAARSRVVQREMHGIDATLDEFWEEVISKPLECAWRTLFADLYKSVATPSPSYRPRSRLKQALDNLDLDAYAGNRRRSLERKQKMAIRLQREVEDVEERLERGLEHCHEFRSGEILVQLTHSDSNWLRIHSFHDDVIKALKRNKLEHVVHLTIDIKPDTSEADITRFFDNFKSTSCTSIHFCNDVRIPDSVLHKLSPNILSITGSQPPLEALNAAVEWNRSRLEESRKTTVEFANLMGPSWMNSLSVADSPTSPPNFTVRFFGPESSDHLTLQVIHSCSAADACLTVEPKESPFTYLITPSDEFVLQNIAIGNHPSALTFEPGRRNTITFIAPSTTDRDAYYLRDVELLDKDGNRYNGEATSDSNQEGNDTDSNDAPLV